MLCCVVLRITRIALPCYFASVREIPNTVLLSYCLIIPELTFLVAHLYGVPRVFKCSNAPTVLCHVYACANYHTYTYIHIYI